MMIPYSKQNITSTDIDAVIETLQSEFLTQGPMISRFEKAITDYCGSRYGVAMNSATSALHAACLALNVGPGHIVWTSPITFVASANCARYCGAEVDFIDINPKTYNLDINRLEEKLVKAKELGKLPKVLIPVHFTGQSCDMQAIHLLSKQYGFYIIEDAAHAIGGTYKNQPIGNCRYSDITIFSFHPVKIITTGEGGMAVTNDGQIAKKLSRLRSHGITRDDTEMTRESDGLWYYQQLELGYNFRMTDLQAALGISQMQQLHSGIKRRQDLADYYNDLLSDMPIICPTQDPDAYSSMHLYVIRLQLECIKATHKQVFERLRHSGIGVNLHYIPVYKHPYYEKLGYSSLDFPEAEKYYASAITLPLYPKLSHQQQHDIINALKKAIAI